LEVGTVPLNIFPTPTYNQHKCNKALCILYSTTKEIDGSFFFHPNHTKYAPLIKYDT